MKELYERLEPQIKMLCNYYTSKETSQSAKHAETMQQMFTEQYERVLQVVAMTVIISLESALGDIKHKSYVEALPDNGEDNGIPEKVVTYENVRVIFNDLMDSFTVNSKERECMACKKKDSRMHTCKDFR